MKFALPLLVLSFAIARLWSAPAKALAFTTDNSALLVGAHRLLELRSVPDGKSIEQIPCEISRISSVMVDRRNSLIAIAGGTPGESGAAIVFAWDQKGMRHHFTNFSDLVTSARISSDATRLAVASADGSAAIHPLATDHARSVVRLRGHSGPVLDIAWSPQDDFVVTTSADRSLKVWSAEEGKLMRSFSHHTEPVHAVVFRPRSGDAAGSPVECASASDDATVRIWQPEIGRMVRIVRGHDGAVFALAYTPDGSALFSAGKEGVIRRIDTESDQILGRWKGHDEPVYGMVASPDGQYLASGDWGGNVQLWRITNGQLQRF